jgi:hypothetical protein
VAKFADEARAVALEKYLKVRIRLRVRSPSSQIDSRICSRNQVEYYRAFENDTSDNQDD